MRPLLKWAGGKSRLAPMIAETFGESCDGTWFEPFAGSCAVYLHLHATGAVRRGFLSDANPRLVRFHVAVRDQVEHVIDRLSELPTAPGWRDAYDGIRAAFNAGPPAGGPEQAARLLWLNHACFNGLYRVNRAGNFNVPSGAYDHVSLPEPDHIRTVSGALQDAELACTGFEPAMLRAGAGDHVYCDPPYTPDRPGGFVAYAGEFGPGEHARLAESARMAAARGAIVVLSNHAAGEHHYPGAQITPILVRRSISRSGDRTPAREILARIR
jgi:DNA adenine methylase